MTEILRRLVVEHKLVDYQYFMDNITQYEIVLLQDMEFYSDKVSYEQMRYIVWSNLSPYMNHRIKPEKLMPFITDNDNIEVFDKDEVSAISNNVLKMFEKNASKINKSETQTDGK